MTTTFAVSDSDSKVAEGNMLYELEDALLSSEGGYSYTAPDAGSFLIESVTGAVSITNEVAAIEFRNCIVPMPSFDYYKIVDNNGDLRFYQADVSKDPDRISNFAYIGLYIEDGPVYSIHIHYAIEAENKLYNIKAPTGAAAVSATDDIDGANNRNATLTITLTAGNIYYLEAFRYGTPYNYNLIMQPTS